MGRVIRRAEFRIGLAEDLAQLRPEIGYGFVDIDEDGIGIDVKMPDAQDNGGELAERRRVLMLGGIEASARLQETGEWIGRVN